GIKDVKVYSSTEKGSSCFRSKGLFASIIKNSFFYLPIEDEGRLTNFNIREHFLTSIFTLSSFKDIKNIPTIDKLKKFHSMNKLLLMSYSQLGLKRLDKIITNYNNLNLNEVYLLYEEELYNQLKTSPKYSSKINTFNHAFGYFSDYLSKEEKDFYLEILQKYSTGKLSTNVIINLLKNYAIRFNNEYLLSQTLLEPYPEALLDLNDSGNGICID
ncbi:MAG: YbgA family protein, partial [Sarcina sp.]